MFSTSGGLETLTLSLVCLASGAEMSLLSCQLSVIISQTLSACITDNRTYFSLLTYTWTIIVRLNNYSVSFSFYNLFYLAILASGLAQYGVVSHLFSLLASPHMSCEDRLTVLLTLGHCTEASGKTCILLLEIEKILCLYQMCSARVSVFHFKHLIAAHTATVFPRLRMELLLSLSKSVFSPACRKTPVPAGTVWRPAAYHSFIHRGHKRGG